MSARYRAPLQPSSTSPEQSRACSGRARDRSGSGWTQAVEPRCTCRGADRTSAIAAADSTRDATERLIALLRGLPAGIALLRGRDHVFEFVNDFYRQLIGGRDVLGLPVREALPEVDGQGFFELLDGVYETGRPYYGNEARVLLARGDSNELTELFVNFVYLPTRDDAGEIDGVLAHATDVTELVHSRQRVELLAKERDDERQRLADVLDQLPAGVVIGDIPTGRLTLANRAWREFFGVPPGIVDDIAAYAIFEGKDEVGRAYTPEEYPLSRTIATGETVVGEQISFVRADGVPRWIEINSAPIHDRTGAMTAGVAAFFDVTERRRAESLVESHQGVLRLVAEGAPLPEILDRLTRLIEEFAGGDILASVLLLEGDTLRHGAAPSLPDAYNEAIDGITIGPSVGSCGTAAFRDERVVVTDIEHDPLWADFAELALGHGLRACWSTPIRSTRGNVLGTFALYYPVVGDPPLEHERLVAIATRTAAVAIERARLEEERNALLAAEQAARTEAERRARAAVSLEYVADGVCLVGRDGAARLWNPAAERILGAGKEDVVDSVFSRVEPGTTATLPVEVGGGDIWLSISAVEFEDGVVYAFRDVTDEHRLEALRADMIATVSHELRTPLAAVYGAAMTLQRANVRDDTVPALISMIGSEAERLRTLIDEILIASQLERTSVTELELTTFDAAALAEDVVRALAPDGGIAVRCAHRPLPTRGDADRVRQVLSNLVDNAVKYGGDPRGVTVDVHREGDHIRFAVTDHGPGIPPRDQRRIFDKFVRLDPNLLTGVGGTGLGLFIARELVERMRGRITVSSTPGEGSTFAFELPGA